MQPVLQDPSHTGAALQLFDQLKSHFPNCGNNPKLCFERVRDESRHVGSSAASTPTNGASALPDYYYPWNVSSSTSSPYLGRGSCVMRRPRTPSSPAAGQPPSSPTVRTPQLRFVYRDDVGGGAPAVGVGLRPHLFGPRWIPPQRSSSMSTFENNNTPTSNSQQQYSPRPQASTQQNSPYVTQVSYPGSPLSSSSGRQSPFTFHIGGAAGQQRFRLVAANQPSPSSPVDSAHSSPAYSSMTNLSSGGERRPSFPSLLMSTSQGHRQLLHLPANFMKPLNVVTTDTSNEASSQQPQPPHSYGVYGQQGVQQKQPSIQIRFGVDGNTMVFSPSSSVGNRPTITFGPRAVFVEHRMPVKLPVRSEEYLKSLIENQIERRENLREAAKFQRTRLEELTNDVESLEGDLHARRKRSVSSNTINTDAVAVLHQDTRKLQAEVNVLLKQVSSLRSGELPTSVEEQCNFHKHMGSRGPEGKVAPVKKSSWGISSKFSSENHDKYQKKAFTLPTVGRTNSVDSSEGEHWTCEACTFENHPLMMNCEVCDFPRSKTKDVDDWVYVFSVSPSFFE